MSLTYDEKRSFFYFLILVIVTAFVLVAEDMSDVALGLLGIIWGVYGFFRLVHLTQPVDTPHTLLNLPSRLLFGLAKEQDQRIATTLNRLSQQDVILWLLGSISFIFLALFCSFFPTEITVLKTVHLKQQMVLDFPISNAVNPYAIMKSLSLYGLIGVIFLSALSYSQSRTNIRWAFLILFPIFATGVLLQFFLTSMAHPALWPDLSVLRGGGLGQANILHILTPDLMSNSGTGLISRFTEVGMAGAYGVYILFIPALIVMLKAFFSSKRSYLKPAIGLFCLLALLVLDVFWITSPLGVGLQILGLSIIGLSWGACGSRN